MGDVSREAAEAAIDVLLQERREFPPSPEFVSQAVVSDPGVYERGRRPTSTGSGSSETTELLDWASRRRRGSNGTRRTAPGSQTAS